MNKAEVRTCMLPSYVSINVLTTLQDKPLGQVTCLGPELDGRGLNNYAVNINELVKAHCCHLAKHSCVVARVYVSYSRIARSTVLQTDYRTMELSMSQGLGFLHLPKHFQFVPLELLHWVLELYIPQSTCAVNAGGQ